MSPDAPHTVTMILTVDPLLEPSNGPNYFPFDDNLLYEFNVDNDQDADEDVSFEVRFTTEQNLPGVPVALVGAGNGVPAPRNSPPPVAAGSPLIPPAITALDGPGAAGIGLRQTYEVVMVKNGQRTTLGPAYGQKLIALPSNVGPRTTPKYKKLFEQAIFQLDRGIKVFAGTTDDEFYIDLGATFNSLNFRKVPGPGSTGVPAVLSPQQDRAKVNFVSDDVSGFNVNTIALQVPISLLTKGGNRPAASNPDATLGTYGATLRRQTETRDPLQPVKGDGDWVQVQRMGNPLFNELIIGTGFKDLWSRSDPKDDAQFAAFALDPLIARVAQAAYSAIGVKLTIPTPPRADLLPLVTYAPPIATPGAQPQVIADLLRVNTGVAADAVPQGEPPRPARGRCGRLPQRPPPVRRRDRHRAARRGRRRAAPGLNKFPNNRLGDGVNTNEQRRRDDVPLRGAGAGRPEQPAHRSGRARLCRRQVPDQLGPWTGPRDAPPPASCWRRCWPGRRPAPSPSCRGPTGSCSSDCRRRWRSCGQSRAGAGPTSTVPSPRRGATSRRASAARTRASSAMRGQLWRPGGATQTRRRRCW